VDGTRGALAPEVHSWNIALETLRLAVAALPWTIRKKERKPLAPSEYKQGMEGGGGLLRDCAGEKGHWDLYPYPIRLRSTAFCKHLNAYPVPVTDFPGATVSMKNTFEW